MLPAQVIVGAILSTTSIENSCNFSQDANSSKFGVRIAGGSPVGYLNGVLDAKDLYSGRKTIVDKVVIKGHQLYTFEFDKKVLNLFKGKQR